ncbi:MAG: hypothetical protein KGO92_01545 [Bacteroidota bacterium]|nr:hypothetical protein [Bacteroidota bacterium]
MIQINQHNYESIFLLYLDGELSAGDRLVVEGFVQSHPHLGEELAMLQQLRLENEPVMYPDKSSLYRSEAKEIHAGNYEEYFLSYVDNELNEADKSLLETYVLQHPELQSEFTLLKQTRLEPEAFVFADKASLYRKEEKKPVVFYMRWQTMGMAASLIGFAFLLWTQFADRSVKVTTTTAARLEKINAPVSAQPVPLPADNNTVTASVTKPENRQTETGSSSNQTKDAETRQQTAIDQPLADHPITEPDATPLSMQQTVETHASRKAEVITGSFDGPEIAKVPVQKIIPGNHPIAGLDRSLLETNENSGSPKEVLAQEVVYKEIDITADDDKKTLLLGSLELNKDKLRGLFRKASSLFRSKPKVNDETADNPSPVNTRSLQ